MTDRHIGHQIIMASAGTGKTYALTGRIIRLLALGVPLERIVALTFTRAAAGEIFDTLVTRLAEAARAPDGAAQAVLGVDAPGTVLDASAVVRLLRDVLARMHLSPIGTLDSFFVKMVRLFPFEFGIGGDFSVLEGYPLDLEIQRVLHRIIVAGSRSDAAALRAFLEAFKRATFGGEEKRLHDLLEKFVADYHDLYLNAVLPRDWGRSEAIWEGQTPWWDRLDPQTLGKAVGDLRREVLQNGLTEAQVERWDAFFVMTEAFEPGSLISKPGDDILGKLLDCLGDLRRGDAAITVMRRKVALSPSQCALALRLAGHVVGCLIAGRLEATRGVRDILTHYERVYDGLVRRSGRMAFQDVTHLVTRVENASARLNVEFRLDGRYDHWAIDEFQDTSRQQWQGVASLIDEIVQDPEGRRSFFAVGDIKQAIYGWRGGDSRLLSEIRDYYDIPEKPLSDSYRCAPAVIEAVNGVFDDLAGSDLPEPVVRRWAEGWRQHRSARPGVPSCAQLDEVRVASGSSRPAKEDWHDAIASKLQEIAPWTRGLSAAVLVRSNTQGAEVTEALRAKGIPTVWTGDKAIADNPAVAAVIDLFRFAQHPGDTFAWNHLLMTPLAAAIRPGEGGADRLAAAVLRDVHAHGFAYTVEQWLMRLQEWTVLDSFSRQRLRALLDAAEAFDRSGSRSCLDFVEFVEAYTVSDIAADRTVQVMTIHRSKGLGFDLVLVPLFAGRSGLDSVTGQDVLLGPREPGAMVHQWLMLAPPKAAALADPALTGALERSSETACFEELCVLYVAMTRAKQGLYLFAPPPPKREGALHTHTLVRRQLVNPDDGNRVLFGDADWYRTAPSLPTPMPEAAQRDVTSRRSLPTGRRRFRRRSPSGRRLQGRPAAELLRPAAPAALAFGSAMHALFERLDWLEVTPLEEAVQRWHRRVPLADGVADAVARVVTRAVAHPEVAAVFSRPSQPCELWRERSFEMILADEWVSGTFDRVVLFRDQSGALEAAEIVDFKSDHLASEAACLETAQRYAEQLSLYARALSRLTGLDDKAITRKLVFTDIGRTVTLA